MVGRRWRTGRSGCGAVDGNWWGWGWDGLRRAAPQRLCRRVLSLTRRPSPLPPYRNTTHPPTHTHPTPHEQHTVENIFMEYSPGVAERNFNWQLAGSNPLMLMGMRRAGFTILHLDAMMRFPLPDFAAPPQLPEMEEVRWRCGMLCCSVPWAALCHAAHKLHRELATGLPSPAFHRPDYLPAPAPALLLATVTAHRPHCRSAGDRGGAGARHRGHVAGRQRHPGLPRGQPGAGGGPPRHLW